MIQTYGDTWTIQLFVLGDFYNVAAAEPDFADELHGQQGQVRHRPRPRMRGFQHLQDVLEAGYLNEDFGAAKFDDGLAHGRRRARARTTRC